MKYYRVSFGMIGSAYPSARILGVAHSFEEAANLASSAFWRAVIGSGGNPKQFEIISVECLGLSVFKPGEPEPDPDPKPEDGSGFDGDVIEIA